MIEEAAGRPGRTPAALDRSRSEQHKAGPWGERSLAAVAALFALFLGLPVVTLVARAILDGSLAKAVTAPVVLDALSLSLVTTAISLVLTVTLGLPLAFVMARRQFRGKGWLEAIVDLPIVLPPSVAGLALLLVFGRRGLLAVPFEVLGVSVPFTTIAVILAQTFVSRPSSSGRRGPASPRWIATSRTPRGSTGHRNGSCSARSRCRSPGRPSRPGSS